MIRSRSERARRKREPSGELPWDVVEMLRIPRPSRRADPSPGTNLQIVVGCVDLAGTAHVQLFTLDLPERHAGRGFDVLNVVLDLPFAVQGKRRHEDGTV